MAESILGLIFQEFLPFQEIGDLVFAMKILIVEDEQPAVDRLTRLIHNFNPAYEVIGCLESVQEGLEWFEAHSNPDLIFLDVHLSDGNSFEILRNTGITCPVIFTTSHAEYAVNAFEAFAIDYLFKPIKREAFTNAMNRFLQRRPVASSEQQFSTRSENQVNSDAEQKIYSSSRILLKMGQQLKVLELNEAAYFLYQDRLTLFIGADEKKYPLDYSLDQLEKLVDSSNFYRINRQCIINFKFIDQIITYSKSRLKIVLSDRSKASFDVSADRTSDFKQWLVCPRS